MKIVDLRGGGKLRGPGTGTSDSIVGVSSAGPVRVSNTEYVIKARSAAKVGKRALDFINKHGALPRKQQGGEIQKRLDERKKAGEEAIEELRRTSTGKRAPPLPPGGTWPYVPSGERSLLRDIFGFSKGGSVKAKLMAMKNRGKVMRAMAERRAGYQGGGLVGGMANRDNERQFDEAGVDFPLRRVGTQAPMIEAPPSKPKVDLPPNASIGDKLVTPLMNALQGRRGSLSFKKGGMVKKGLRC